DLDGGVAGLVLGGEAVVPVVELVVAFGPVLGEGCGDAVDGGAAHLDVGVAPFVRGAGVAAPFGSDADAAGEGGVFVGDQDFAVAAVVLAHRGEAGGFAEPGDADACVGHRVQQVGFDLLGAAAVKEEADADACAGSAGEGVGEFVGDAAAPRDQGHH